MRPYSGDRMKSRTLLLGIVLAVIAVVIAAMGIQFHSTPPVVPSSLPIPSGTRFPHVAILSWVVRFNVRGPAFASSERGPRSTVTAIPSSKS